ncbi:putative exopolyphosphatase [Aspergillus fijiensis CBS 313.89]|uniref:DHH phosphoesterase n=1 Tax=Aspergillus fijiensis CBS 313.89 TaxID=1448319 RepID=A0A8G1S0W5_9EURO|nr:DHH phosphoesterase [Aspergillus fijiensis CBS 313.89]RAK80376.1 DHH phosphoesterase [Aspergillus fijiensis CBS 313.89]
MPALDRSLFRFLAQSLQTHHRFLAGRITRPEETPIYVIGNPSADVDSIVSALVYAYFAHPRPHVPLINLPDVPSGPELRRLRPEFLEALHLATHPAAPTEQPWEIEADTTADLLRSHLLTVADFAAHLAQSNAADTLSLVDAVLVDWNALPNRSPSQKGQGTLPGLEAITFQVVGCIDHHVDEDFLPPIAADQPFLIQPTGSCASLVVSMLERMGRWTPHPLSSSSSTSTTTPSPQNPPTADTSPEELTTAAAHEHQLSKLALAPILIDTANFTAKEKVTDADTLSYSFLRAKINSTNCQQQVGSIAVGISSGEKLWDHHAFYRRIATAKENSLELLTVPEVLGRDYKEWVEVPSSVSSSSVADGSSSSSSKDGDDNAAIKIGICSVVKSLPWVMRKADSNASPDRFLDELVAFARHRGLDIVVLMTAFAGPAAAVASASPASPGTSTSPGKEGRFHREILVGVPSSSERRPTAIAAAEAFVQRGRKELGLETWRALLDEDEAVVQTWLDCMEPDDSHRHENMWMGVWVQGDVTKSRKQVAPLVREAVLAV